MFTDINGADCSYRNNSTEFCFSPRNDFETNTLYFRARRFGFPSARPAKKQLLSAGKDKCALGGMKIDS